MKKIILGRRKKKLGIISMGFVIRFYVAVIMLPFFKCLHKMNMLRFGAVFVSLLAGDCCSAKP